MSKQPWDSYDTPQPQDAEHLIYRVGKREAVFGLFILLFGFLLCNCILFAGVNLGVAVAVIGCILCSFLYLTVAGCKPDGYSIALLLMSVVMAAGFARTDDSLVKFAAICFLMVSINLALCLIAGQGLYSKGGLLSLLNAPRAAFRFGCGKAPQVFRGTKQAIRRSGSLGQKGGAFLLGLCIAVPVVAIMFPLLISADAAFDGLMAMLPEFRFRELFVTLIFGTGFGCFSFVRAVALRYAPKSVREEKTGRGINAITVNTVLGTVCLLYAVYLLSQLAYLSGGFAGILPEEYTLAQYARRGFFEMALLSGCNLALMVFALGLVKKQSRAPRSTRLLCLFIGIVTLFLIATASAKMFLYIGSYGLTRLRVLTQIIMLFLAVTTLIVSVWLFVPKLPYMKAILLVALVIGAAVIWTDVDTQVAHYNVDAYLSGQLETVDVHYLYRLGNGAIPELARLTREAPNKDVATTAQTYLTQKKLQLKDIDFRNWNYVNHIAAKTVKD